jgi:hypothetical protein
MGGSLIETAVGRVWTFSVALRFLFSVVGVSVVS